MSVSGIVKFQTGISWSNRLSNHSNFQHVYCLSLAGDSIGSRDDLLAAQESQIVRIPKQLGRVHLKNALARLDCCVRAGFPILYGS